MKLYFVFLFFIFFGILHYLPALSSQKSLPDAKQINTGNAYSHTEIDVLFPDSGLKRHDGYDSDKPGTGRDSRRMPEIAITSCKIIDPEGVEEITVGENTSRINLRYNQALSIEFSLLDFTFPGGNKYKYSLQELGKPEKWLNLEEQHSLNIYGLNSGEYIFKVKAENRHNTWATESRTLRLVVEAPFWNTRIAYLCYLFLVLFGIYFFTNYRIRTLKKSNRMLRERESQSFEISRQRELLSKRNKNIEDSLKYAKRIQSAMLDTPGLFKKYFQDSFIFHRPKDIVSGDFYWISEKDDHIFVAAVDCTGHGVPGAFMSVIGFELFRKIINMQGIRDPGNILNALNENFEEIFKVENDVSLQDGMDLAFCVFDKKKRILRFAGAFSPLYLVSDNRLIEIKGDRMSINADRETKMDGQRIKQFTSHELMLKPGDMIYIFSDGYADQFGGPEGKKYKYRRFRHLLLTIHDLPLKTQKRLLIDSFEEWKGNFEQIDDILVIGIKADFESS